MTLGWREFVALAAGLVVIALVLALTLERDISETLYRLEVRQYEQKLGFEVGLVKGGALGPPAGIWGIASVTPGGAMDQAGMRSEDVIIGHHGYSFTELSWAISEAAKGGTACVFVMNANEARTASGRDVCLNGTTKISQEMGNLLTLSRTGTSTTLLDLEVDFGQFLHGAQVVRARHKEVSGQNLGDHGAHHRERGLMGAPALAFALKPACLVNTLEARPWRAA